MTNATHAMIPAIAQIFLIAAIVTTLVGRAPQNVRHLLRTLEGDAKTELERFARSGAKKR